MAAPLTTPTERPAPKPRIVYLHGDGVLHWDWGWVVGVRDELRAAGFPTFFELFPDSIEARARYWLPFIEDHVRVGVDDVLLGWSCGAVAAMRIAERRRVRGLVLLAPYHTNSMNLDVVRRAGWVEDPWNWAAIRANTETIAVFQSDDDPYISQKHLGEVASWLAAQVHVIPGAGHFGERDHFPELIDYIIGTYG